MKANFRVTEVPMPEDVKKSLVKLVFKKYIEPIIEQEKKMESEKIIKEEKNAKSSAISKGKTAPNCNGKRLKHE